MIRKIIISILAGLALLFIAGWLTLQYQIHQSLHVLIPSRAQTILRINNYELIKSLARDWWQQSSTTKARRKREQQPKPGLSIPINLIAYTLAPTGNRVWYTRLVIGHKNKFDDYVNREMQQLPVHIAGMKIAQSKNGIWIIAYNENTAAIACILEDSMKTAAINQLPDILTLPDATRLSESGLKQICDRNDAVSLEASRMSGSLNYRNHRIDLEMSVTAPELSIPATTHIMKLPEDAVLHCWWNARLSATTPATIDTRDFHLSADSLFRLSNGQAEIAWTGNTIEKQPIVQYETDENFNEVARTTLKEKAIPTLWGQMGHTQAPLLMAYLRQTEAIVEDSVNARLFPFFTVKVSAGKENGPMNLYSGPVIPDFIQVQAPGFAGIEINFRNAAIGQVIPSGYAPFWKDLDRLTLIATGQGHQMHLSGHLSFRDKKESIFDIAANYLD